MAQTTPDGESPDEGADRGTTLPPMPDVIDSAEGKLVYLALATTGETKIDELVDRLALPRITMLSLLDTLEDRGVIERVGSNRVAPVHP